MTEPEMINLDEVYHLSNDQHLAQVAARLLASTRVADRPRVTAPSIHDLIVEPTTDQEKTR